MADKNISSLPAIETLSDDALLVAEQQGEAGKVSGKQIKDFAKAGVSAYVEAAQEAAQNALAAAQQAQEAVASVQDASAQAAAAKAANEAAQAAMQAAEAAQAAAEAAAELAKQQAAEAAETAAADAVSNVGAALTGYVTAAQSAQAAAEAARDQAQAIAGGDFLPLAGGTMTGPIVLAGAPTEDLHPATKKFVDDAVSGVSIQTDAEPTEDSTNPVQSGGVKTYVDAQIGDISSILDSINGEVA